MQTPWIVDRRVDIGTARFEQQHLDAAIHESASRGGTGGARAHDDDVGLEVVDVAVCNGGGD